MSHYTDLNGQSVPIFGLNQVYTQPQQKTAIRLVNSALVGDPEWHHEAAFRFYALVKDCNSSFQITNEELASRLIRKIITGDRISVPGSIPKLRLFTKQFYTLLAATFDSPTFKKWDKCPELKNTILSGLAEQYMLNNLFGMEVLK